MIHNHYILFSCLFFCHFIAILIHPTNSLLNPLISSPHLNVRFIGSDVYIGELKTKEKDTRRSQFYDIGAIY